MKKTIYLSLLLLLCSCKGDWLDIRPDDALVVPRTVGDYQALLDNTYIMNMSYVGGLGEVSAADFGVTDAVFLTNSAMIRNSYTWSTTDDFFENARDPDWRAGWQRILHANIVLEGLEKVDRTEANKARWDQVKGAALFHRAYDLHALAQQYCKAYDPAHLGDMGLPLRLSSNLNIKVARATLKATYDRILDDMAQAIPLLPMTAPVKTRPTKAAGQALLARIYLYMGQYDQALALADRVIQAHPQLLAYSDIDASQGNPFALMNDEVIFHAQLTNYSIFSASRLQVDPGLLDIYADHDLRRSLFFGTNNNTTFFRGSYGGDNIFFAGLATDEMYLVQAECRARTGDLQGAAQALNTMLRTRWAAEAPYRDFSTSGQDEMLSKILSERRKQLCFRGLRWSDLKRLNKEPALQVTLGRTVSGQVHQLLPNDVRYALPLDDNEITLGGLAQNPRK